MSPRRAGAPPAYALYGEAAPPPLRLHVEAIAERSARHGWEIRPHRHAALCQLLVVRRGALVAELEGVAHALRAPALVTVPAQAVHGFRFGDDVEGWVFSLHEGYLAGLLATHAGLAAALQPLRVQRPLRGRWPELWRAAQALRDAAAAPDEAHAAAAVDAALLRLAVAAARALPAAGDPPRRGQPAGAPPPPRAVAQVQRLRELVEAQFRRQPAQSTLAVQVGVSTAQLNRACRQVLGHPARELLHRRLLLQAQRELAFGSLPVRRIAFDLGFADAAYFARFVRQRTGLSPLAWRQALQRADAAAAPVRVA